MRPSGFVRDLFGVGLSEILLSPFAHGHEPPSHGLDVLYRQQHVDSCPLRRSFRYRLASTPPSRVPPRVAMSSVSPGLPIQPQTKSANHGLCTFSPLSSLRPRLPSWHALADSLGG